MKARLGLTAVVSSISRRDIDSIDMPFTQLVCSVFQEGTTEGGTHDQEGHYGRSW